MRCGMSAIVRTLAVTSSPTAPSPRVAARTSSPRSYRSEQLKAVDLGLGGHRHEGIGGRFRNAHAGDELADLLVRKAFSRLSIGRAWATLASAVVGAAPSRFDGEVGAHQVRKPLLELAVLADQRVIVGVGNLRRVLVVIEPVVARDLLGQPHQPVGGLGFVADRVAAMLAEQSPRAG